MSIKRKMAVLATSAAAVLALSACSGAPSGETPTGDSDQQEIVDITVGVMPASEIAGLQVGIDEGFFEEEGLNVTTQFAAGGSALVPALIAGDVQFSFASAAQTVPALSEGLPIRVVAPAATSGENQSLIVSADSPFTSVEDLAGKRIGVVLVNSLADFLTRGTFEEAGLAATDFEPLEIAYPDAFAALEAGRTDAAFISEPFQTTAVQAGARIIAYPFLEVNGGDPLVSTEWITTNQYAESNPDVVERFERAILKANAYASENEQAARDAVRTLLPDVDPDVLADMVLPTWPTEFDPDSYEVIIGLLTNYGTLTDPPSIEDILPAEG